ncbi:hypothetical protein R6Q59_014936 [Mikania micrantha]
MSQSVTSEGTRGEDTRKTFVDHLHLALLNKGITTYKDDQTIEKRERINDQLIKSIEESRFHLIVSPRTMQFHHGVYRSSRRLWSARRRRNRNLLPAKNPISLLLIDLLAVSGDTGQCPRGCFPSSPPTLKPADLINLALIPIVGSRPKITHNRTHISLKLHLINWSTNEKLVGMETCVKKVISSLETDSEDDVRMVGISGTSCFDHISFWFDFEGKIFVENVREVSKGSSSGLKKLQKLVHKDVLNDQRIDVGSVSDRIKKMKKMMPGRKVLVVLAIFELLYRGDVCFLSTSSSRCYPEQLLLSNNI